VIDDDLVPWHERPRFRGRVHQLAAVASAFGLLWLVRVAPSTQARVVAVVYGVSAILLYLTSTTYHVFSRGDTVRGLMRRVDHSMIYILIAGTFTPVCVLAMDGWFRWVVLAIVWTGAALGFALKLGTGLRFRRFGFALYLVLGWTGLLLLPSLVGHPLELALIVLAGVLYTVGAIMFSLRWPLPASRWFGYHEVWHVFGVVAGALLFAVNLSIIGGSPA
jgi:hemolysin III